MAKLEGGVAPIVTAWGIGAIATTPFTLLKTGDCIVASSSLYGGTFNLLNPNHALKIFFSFINLCQ